MSDLIEITGGERAQLRRWATYLEDMAPGLSPAGRQVAAGLLLSLATRKPVGDGERVVPMAEVEQLAAETVAALRAAGLPHAALGALLKFQQAGFNVPDLTESEGE